MFDMLRDIGIFLKENNTKILVISIDVSVASDLPCARRVVCTTGSSAAAFTALSSGFSGPS